MGENSHIEWTTHTFNPWRGCTKVSDGCKNCYAETLSGRNPKTLGQWGPKGSRVIAAESYWRKPVQWDKVAKNYPDECANGHRLNKRAQAMIGNARCPARYNEQGDFDGNLPECGAEILENVRPRVFCASLADVFEGRETMPAESWEAVQEARFRLFGLIQNTPNLDWLLLTKRPQNILPILSSLPLAKGNPAGPSLASCLPYPNVWLGTSVEDQKAADERIPLLLQVPAAVRFLSCEPLLGPIEFEVCIEDGDAYGDGATYWDRLTGSAWMKDGFEKEMPGFTPGIDWVIVGGESGSYARPMSPDWARSLRDQCSAAGVPFFFKQWGEWASGYDLPAEHKARIFSFVGHVFHNSDNSKTCVYKVGKKAAGRQLDGREWSEFPK